MLKYTCQADWGGFSKGTDYDVVGIGETVAMMINDDGKLVSFAHSTLNDDALWKRVEAKKGKGA